MQELRNIIESLLFVAEEPLSIEKLKGVLETAEGKTIRSVLEQLREEYDAKGGGFRLCEVAGGWQLRSRPEYHDWIKRMLQPNPQRLSKAALETLAIVAYKQPIIRAEIEHIRGVDCGGILRQLMERKLVRVLGRKEIAGRPLIYATTKLFLELFDLKDLKDLPTPKEIEALSDTDDKPQPESASQNPEKTNEIHAHEADATPPAEDANEIQDGSAGATAQPERDTQEPVQPIQPTEAGPAAEDASDTNDRRLSESDALPSSEDDATAQ